jgi:hypothetical protein
VAKMGWPLQVKSFLPKMWNVSKPVVVIKGVDGLLIALSRRSVKNPDSRLTALFCLIRKARHIVFFCQIIKGFNTAKAGVFDSLIQLKIACVIM